MFAKSSGTNCALPNNFATNNLHAEVNKLFHPWYLYFVVTQIKVRTA